MATYAIGDLQGCYLTLQLLLDRISFNPASDRLWFVGDLVNRGQGSLECLRFVAGLGDRATVVLGNHDLHLLALAEGFERIKRKDTLQPVLDAPDRDDLMHWLRGRSLMHVEGDFVMVHAGLMPQWSLALAKELARDIAAALQGPDYRDLLKHMYGNMPDAWDDRLAGLDRQRITINAMTRMRVIEADGRMNMKFAGVLADRPAKSQPWFAQRHPSLAGKTLVAGHWSALGYFTAPGFFGLDSGCIWGHELTALRLEDRAVFQVPCAEAVTPEGWD